MSREREREKRNSERRITQVYDSNDSHTFTPHILTLYAGLFFCCCYIFGKCLGSFSRYIKEKWISLRIYRLFYISQMFFARTIFHLTLSHVLKSPYMKLRNEIIFIVTIATNFSVETVKSSTACVLCIYDQSQGIFSWI